MAYIEDLHLPEINDIPENIKKLGQVVSIVDTPITFVSKKGINRTNDETFYFTKADGKILVYIEYPGVGVYYTEDGKEYKPPGPIEKINKKISNILSSLVEKFYNLLHTELIFEEPEMIKIPERPGNNGIKNKIREHSKKPKQK